MLWLMIIALLVVLLIGVLLLSLLVIEIDTRVPGASMRWGALAKASIWYDDEWRMYIQVLFYRKTIGLARIKSKPVNKKPPAAKKKSIRLLKSPPMRCITWTKRKSSG